MPVQRLRMGAMDIREKRAELRYAVIARRCRPCGRKRQSSTPHARGVPGSLIMASPVHRTGRSEPDGVRLRLPDAPRRDTAPQRPPHGGRSRLTGRVWVGVGAVGGIRPLLRYDAWGLPQFVAGAYLRSLLRFPVRLQLRHAGLGTTAGRSSPQAVLGYETGR